MALAILKRKMAAAGLSKRTKASRRSAAAEALQENSEAEQTAIGADLQLVVDRCPAIEIPRLRDAGWLPARRLQ